jgi:hypothetical protein
MINFSLGIHMKVFMVFAVMTMAACSSAKTETVADTTATTTVDSAGVINVTADSVRTDSVK